MPRVTLEEVSHSEERSATILHDFAMVKGKPLIVNPSDRTIADVIAG